MANHGKLWSIDDDQKLLANPEMPDYWFAQGMGRSAHAIRCRRTHLAVKLHRQSPANPLHECVALLGGDLEEAKKHLDEWRAKEQSFASFLDSRKRKAEPVEPRSAEGAWHKPADPEGLGPGWRKGPSPPDGAPWPSKADREQIALVCASIREEDGRLGTLWKDPALAPCLVQHYQGFEAYARVVQGWGQHP
jgi:hypothetical protein